jgi:hypothetical protein
MKRKALLAACLLLVTMLFLNGCAPNKTPYELNDLDNFTVSIKYDANGGLFTDNTTVITDSYNIADLAPNDQGQVQIALLPPDDPGRGTDAFAPRNNGYFLAGWYSNRLETTDEAGNITYSYEDKWDFENDLLSLDPNGNYTASKPELTLYAAWVPLFEIELYALDSGEKVSTMTFDPTVTEEVLIPAWDETTGTVKMNGFPEREGYTFNGLFYDELGSQAVSTASVSHPGTVDTSTGTAADISMKLYVDYLEGDWYQIYNAEQFADNASLKGNYILHADLDFSDEIWPTNLMYGNFTGTIEGNGHTIKNIDLRQTNNSKVNAGLFGNLTEDAKLNNVIFDHASFTIEAGTRVKGTSFGLLAGTISDGAVLTDVRVANSVLKIDSGCYFGADDYSIGLICGMGSDTKLDPSGITCTAVGDAPETVNITVNGNTVTVAIGE